MLRTLLGQRRLFGGELTILHKVEAQFGHFIKLQGRRGLLQCKTVKRPDFI